ncbi:MAG: nucleoside triphosphate pyrophosphohydrolase family protein [Acidobacteriota bacterium]|nr:nucleoside triphosphate pyrophosphohydrolase family protein [Acidobacteriota bacterium]
MDISEYQAKARLTDRSNKQPWIGLTQNALGLTTKVGKLAGILKKKIRDGVSYQTFTKDARIQMGQALWYLTTLASHLNMNLDEIAQENLAFHEERWATLGDGQRQLFSHLLDGSYSLEEQIPRQFTARFELREGPNSTSWLPIVQVWIDGVPFGDPIDDNIGTEDFYRLHDVLHIAHAAILGWSPVLRKLLGRKRKSRPEVDKFQDGARARDTEEALARLIRSEAKRNNYYAGVSAIDTPFLIKVQSLVADLEVGVRQAGEWQHCILEAYRVFRLLKENSGGYIDVSLPERSLSFDVLPTFKEQGSAD